MKKTLSILLMFLMQIFVYGQCIRNISTNPENPENTEFLNYLNNPNYTVNPFLNNFKWYDYGTTVPAVDFSPIKLAGNVGWQIPDLQNTPGNDFNMFNPFSNSSASGNYSYLLKPYDGGFMDRDWHNEDGWELLWLGTGFFPNGERYNQMSSGNPFEAYGSVPLNNPSIPYIVLYNKYRGIIRVISTVFFGDEKPNHIKVSLQFLREDNEQPVSGLLRHANAYDSPLDQQTKVFSITSPSYNPSENTSWGVVDFAVGYDPCTCIYPSRLRLKFNISNEINFQGKIYQFGTEIPMNEFQNDNYMERAFTNLQNANENFDVQGSIMYKTIDDFIDAYDKKIEVYNEQLNDYNNYQNNLIRQGLTFVKDLAINGINNQLPFDSLAKLLKINKLSFGNTEADIKKELSKGAKGLLSEGYDLMMAQLFGKAPDKPSRPSMPVVNFTEGTFAGVMTEEDERLINNLYNPGTYSTAYSTNPGGINYPAYNEILGLFSLLQSPSMEVYEKTTFSSEDFYEYSEYFSHFYKRLGKFESTFAIKFKEPLKYKLNHALDFDLEKTNLNGKIIVTLTGNSVNLNEIKLTQKNKFSIKHHFNKQTETKYLDQDATKLIEKELVVSTPFMNLNDIGEEYYYFKLDGSKWTDWEHNTFYPKWKPFNEIGELKVSKIELKLANDLYFNQIGYDENQINTTLVTTYLLYDRSKGVDLIQTNGTYIGNLSDIKSYNPDTIYLNGEINSNSGYINDNSILTPSILASNVVINGDLSLSNIYENLTIKAINSIIVRNEAKVNPNIRLKVEKFMNFGKMPEQTNESLSEFCAEENLYKAKELESRSSTLYASMLAKEAERAKKINLFNKLRVYPNPATNVLYCEMKNYQNGNYTISVKSIIGHELYSRTLKVENNHLEMMDIQDLAPGTYLITVSNRETGYIETEKVIVL